MNDTKIEWATKVWNPVTGCTKVSEGCQNCYAEEYVRRFGKVIHGTYPIGSMIDGVDSPRPFSDVICHPERLRLPNWRTPQRVFVNSMSDLFHNYVPAWFIAEVFTEIAMHKDDTFMILTKRPERISPAMEAVSWEVGENWPGTEPICQMMEAGKWPLPNVWLGVSVEDQKAADERIPLLLQTPAAVRFVSVEPMLGPVDLSSIGDIGDHVCPLDGVKYVQDSGPFVCGRIDWVICGGESGRGHGIRPMHPEWARSLRDQCVEAGVPFFFKQWGEWAPSKMLHEIGVAPGTASHPWGLCQPSMTKCGKKAAGNLLDGQRWQQFPAGGGAE